MFKKLLPTFLFIIFLTSCASPTTSLPVPTPSPSPTPEIESPDWWRTAVFYEIFVRSFYDSNGDGIGDFNGITQKLDYLQSLGITAIWLMPIHPSPSYHGYDVIDYYDVNPEYGTLDDFKRFLNEAHKRDIRVIIDLLINHTSREHEWFKQANSDINSSYRDYYVWQDEKGVGNWSKGQQGYYYSHFGSHMPDLNYNNPKVTEEMLNITNFWLNDIGIDGFRIDAVKYLIEEDGKIENTEATHQWLRGFYLAYKEQDPQAYTIGEVFDAGPFLVKSYSGDELDHLFNFELAYGIIDSVRYGNNSGIKNAIKIAKVGMPDFNFGTFLTNHDQNRVMSTFEGDVDKAKLASFLMFTLPGTPYIYYGEEIGMHGVKPDEDIRLPMQWTDEAFAGFSIVQPWRDPYTSNPNFDYAQINVKNQSGDATSLLEHYRSLIQIRKDNPALQTGTVILLDAKNAGIHAILVSDSNETFLILANLKNEAISEYRIDLKDVELEESSYKVETVYGEHQATMLERSAESFIYKPFETLNPYAMYILKLK